MRVLHISNGYADSTVHSNLTKAIDEIGVQQTVYCPVREARLVGKNQFDGKNIQFAYSFCIKPWYKYFYHLKRWMLYRDMERRVDLQSFDIIYAPSLFSDGGLALKAYKKYGTPYVVAVRNTDINIYLKRLKHTYRTGRKIALNAGKIVFISKGEMEEFEGSEFARPILDRIRDKIVLQPNGIDDYWINNALMNVPRANHDIIYVGRFDHNKNVVRLVEAVLALKNEFNDVKLHLVGGGGINEEIINELVEANPNCLTYHGKVFNLEKLSELYDRCSVFAMPSIHETFGLVYLEAMSRNLAVLYTKGQGIDGLFDRSIGESADALSDESIKEGLRKLLAERKNYHVDIDFEQFRWSAIARKHLAMYQSVIERKIR